MPLKFERAIPFRGAFADIGVVERVDRRVIRIAVGRAVLAAGATIVTYEALLSLVGRPLTLAVVDVGIVLAMLRLSIIPIRGLPIASACGAALSADLYLAFVHGGVLRSMSWIFLIPPFLATTLYAVQRKIVVGPSVRDGSSKEKEQIESANRARIRGSMGAAARAAAIVGLLMLVVGTSDPTMSLAVTLSVLIGMALPPFLGRVRAAFARIAAVVAFVMTEAAVCVASFVTHLGVAVPTTSAPYTLGVGSAILATVMVLLRESRSPGAPHGAERP